MRQSRRSSTPRGPARPRKIGTSWRIPSSLLEFGGPCLLFPRVGRRPTSCVCRICAAHPWLLIRSADTRGHTESRLWRNPRDTRPIRCPAPPPSPHRGVQDFLVRASCGSKPTTVAPAATRFPAMPRRPEADPDPLRRNPRDAWTKTCGDPSKGSCSRHTPRIRPFLVCRLAREQNS